MILCNAKNIVIRCVVIILGVIITAFGCACFLVAELGSDPVTVFVQGLGRTIGVSPGMATNILNGSAFLLLLVFNSHLINIGTAIYTLFLGFFVNSSVAFLHSFSMDLHQLWVNVVILIAGTVSIGVGNGH